MYELCDACIEHLGVLPSQLSLSPVQCNELLAYHRIQNKSQNICSDCVDKSQVQERECFICSSIYTDKDGVIERNMEVDAEDGGGVRFQSSDDSFSSSNAFLSAVLPKEKMTDEEAAAAENKWLAGMKRRGKLLSQEEINQL